MYKLLITVASDIIFNGLVTSLETDFYKESMEIRFNYNNSDFTITLNNKDKPIINISL